MSAQTRASHHARRICILNCCKLIHLTQTWATRLLQWPCGWTPGLQQRCLPTQLRCSFASFRHAMKVQCNSGDYSMLLKTLTSSWSSKLVYQTHTHTLDMSIFAVSHVSMHATNFLAKGMQQLASSSGAGAGGGQWRIGVSALKSFVLLHFQHNCLGFRSSWVLNDLNGSVSYLFQHAEVSSLHILEVPCRLIIEWLRSTGTVSRSCAHGRQRKTNVTHVICRIWLHFQQVALGWRWTLPTFVWSTQQEVHGLGSAQNVALASAKPQGYQAVWEKICIWLMTWQTFHAHTASILLSAW